LTTEIQECFLQAYCEVVQMWITILYVGNVGDL